MFAVFKSGGKQHRVAPGDVVMLEKIPGEAGEIVSFGEVLAVGDDKAQTVGAPLVDGASVAGTIIAQDRAKKIIVFRKKRRKNYRRKAGHRQHVTVVRIEDILTGGRKAAAKKPATSKTAAKKADDDKPAAKKAESAKPAAKKPAAKKPAAKKATGAKPAAKKPAAKKPAAKKPAAKKAD